MQDLKELKLTIGEKYSILLTEDVAPTLYYGTLEGYHYGRFAQYETALYLFIKRPRARKTDRIIISCDTCFILKGKYDKCWRSVKEYETETVTMSRLHRLTYDDLKDNPNLIYYHEFRESFLASHDYEGFLDVTGDYLYNNSIRATEAPNNQGYINYLKGLFTYYNLDSIKQACKEFNILIECINKATEYNW